MTGPRAFLRSRALRYLGVAGLLACGVVFGVRWQVERSVRARLAGFAAARGMQVQCGGVSLRWRGLVLEGLGVRAPLDATGTELALSMRRVEIDVDWQASPQAVRLRGVDAAVRGEPGELWQRLRSSREAGVGAAKAPAVALSVSDAEITWQYQEWRLKVQGGSAQRVAEGWQLGAVELRLADAERDDQDKLPAGAHELRLGQAQLVLSPDRTLQSARIAAVQLGRAKPAASETTTTQDEPASMAPAVAAPAMAIAQRPAKPAPRTRAAEPTEASEPPPRLPWPQVGRWGPRMVAAAQQLSERLPAGAQVLIGGFEVDWEEQLRIGPTPLRLSRHADSLVVALEGEEPVREPDATPLSMHLTVPLHGAAVPQLELDGGPVSLSVLGVRAGDFGVVDPQRAKLSARGRVAFGEPLVADLELQLTDLGIDKRRLSLQPVLGLSLGVNVRASLSAQQRLQIERAELRLGDVPIELKGSLSQPPAEGEPLLGQWSLRLPMVRCAALFGAVPPGLSPSLQEFAFDGDYSFSVELGFDSRQLDAMAFDVRQLGRCRARAVPSWAHPSRFERPFEHTFYDPEGHPRVGTTGPGSGHYAALDDISPFLTVAVLTSEDGGFFHHQGWSKNAMRRALIANVKAGRFRQGASTISMQLARNLFLSRDKTLARKFEELVLTDYLEQAFGKEKMMELYLNLIEFGPNVYGVTDAAEYYFGRTPAELTLPESMFLASLLPSPVKRSKRRELRELVGASRAGVDFLIRAAERTGKINRHEMEVGLTQPVVFHVGGPRPAPRGPQRGSRLEGEDSDEGDFGAP